MNGPAADLIHTYRKTLYSRRVLLFVLFIILLTSLVVNFIVGSANLAYSQLFQAIFSSSTCSPLITTIVWDIRLPYALMAMVIGMGLGLAGAEIQTVLNNPLASPFTLGISSAAALGASVAIVLQIGLPHIQSDWFIASNAFIFALLSALLLDLISRWCILSVANVILFGTALVFAFNALISIMQFIASPQALQNLIFWTLGSLSKASWMTVGILSLVLIISLFFSMRQAWALTVIRLGEERALSFGVNVFQTRRAVLARVGLLSGLTVAFAGTIGFVGLVAPHIARTLFSEDHRFYLPGSVLIGGILLSIASIVSKTLISNTIIPISIVTALIGIPFFLWVIIRRPLV